MTKTLFLAKHTFKAEEDQDLALEKGQLVYGNSKTATDTEFKRQPEATGTKIDVSNASANGQEQQQVVQTRKERNDLRSTLNAQSVSSFGSDTVNGGTISSLQSKRTIEYTDEVDAVHSPTLPTTQQRQRVHFTMATVPFLPKETTKI